jgi:hypothetical protein
MQARKSNGLNVFEKRFKLKVIPSLPQVSACLVKEINYSKKYKKCKKIDYEKT